ncbi:septation protein SepH [Microbacterium sp. No. 7]|uniref:septation protein SepH n=1 Tax=Microbacterium sp. No. 7 TaxID=1714373 RepID=UPI0006D0E306|nr:septation protein SepH [Microbacterium sp. No. 7]ALJ20439.1 hypothetical protein AOA12_11190 [Microbacterium sp. No. 7]
MEQLKVVGTEEGALVLVNESGDRFSLAVDDALRRHLRASQRAAEPRRARANPRDIQSRIRAGLSAEEVAEVLGVGIDDVRRYEAPVLAEREHIVGQALSIPVLLGADLEPDAQPTFGSAVQAKLAEAGASDQRWTSWKDESGWTIKLEFVADDVHHDARWGFDPKHTSLTPQNHDAIQLSRQGSLPEGLIPRLRALDAPPAKDTSRFDSGAFGPRRTPAPDADAVVPEAPVPVSAAVQEAAIKRASDDVTTSAETADLLEALRRRRGQREPMPHDDDEHDDGRDEEHEAFLALFDTLDEDALDDEEAVAPKPAREHANRPADDTPQPEPSRKRGRTSMPSWDEIVFGARSEDNGG